MRAALLQVKSELGDDAVIISNKKVAGGGEHLRLWMVMWPQIRPDKLASASIKRPPT